MVHPSKIRDLKGQVFGRLTVIEEAGRMGTSVRWKCQCQCGNETFVKSCRLIRGTTKSCGCFKIDSLRKRLTKHAMSGTRVYVAWQDMLNRCYNKSLSNYHRYGGRGISVCARWRSFENFLFDMGEPPEGYTLERKDNARNYEPDNVRWATRLDQARNTSRNRFLTINGVTKCAAEWSAILGMKPYQLARRLRRGWALEKAVTTPEKL